MSQETVIVTGASAGVGRAVVREFARRGANIGLIARDSRRLEQTAREVEVAGGKALALTVDVADADAVEQAAARAEQHLGPIDIWINNAMATVFAPVAQTRAEEYRRVTDVTYLGYIYGTQAALRRMVPRDRGMIVQVGSALSYRGIPLQSAYCGAKHAIQGFTESLRCELIHDNSNVKVTMVHLPAVNTPQFEWSLSRMPRRAQPVPPIYQPEVCARAIYHAAHHYRREWNVGLMTDVVTMGNKLLPGVGDWYLGRSGYESQMTPEPDDPNRPNNLWEPVAGDYEARGRFSERSAGHSNQWWLSKHRGDVLIAGLGLALLAAGAVFTSASRRPPTRSA